MKGINSLAEMESLFLTLSDKTRLRILNLMREDEVCVYYFTEVLGESQPKISRHLAYLRNAGIVSARREGKWIYYRIEIPQNLSAENILRDTLEWLEMQDEMREEWKKLREGNDSLTSAENTFFKKPDNIYVSTNIKTSVKEELEIYLL